jgi:hypothetical protein
VFWRLEDSLEVGGAGRTGIVLAGPSSSHTIPGIIVSEIARALSKSEFVIRLEVDEAKDFMSGIHRAPSLATAHDDLLNSNMVHHRAPSNSRLRSQAYRDLLTPNLKLAVAYAWPGIDNHWIRQFLEIATARGIPTAVLCASVPSTKSATAVSIAEILYRADRVYVGDLTDASELARVFGSNGPTLETSRALSLRGRTGRPDERKITAFLPSNRAEPLATLLSAFDAIPEAWVDSYRLHVIMRYDDDVIKAMVADSFHANYVELIGSDISTRTLEELCTTSSALSVTEPALDSRAFSSAVDSGIATVVVTDPAMPMVGRGYVGGLLANIRNPSSVHVALSHALRLKELQFPSPDAWESLAARLSPVTVISAPNILEPVAND